ncbi:MAG: hypothetical protein FWG91_13815 [Lachnospiraceae bacterium]|nr:hypothetical protein [Lachnospiraceae bacterium]
MAKIDDDVKKIAKHIIKGNEARKQRIKNKKYSAYDLMAVEIIDRSIRVLWPNVYCDTARKAMQEAVYQSIVNNTPWEHMGIISGRRQFYEERNALICLVAAGMGMTPPELRGSE